MSYTIESLRPEALDEALALVEKSFTNFVAPGYEPEGTGEFMRFIQYGNISTLCEKGEMHMWRCLSEGKTVGVLAARGTHISLLFVDAAHYRRGIARQLVDTMLAGLGPDTILSVNASPYALAAYRRLGFRETGSEEVKNGIRFTPMQKPPDSEES